MALITTNCLVFIAFSFFHLEEEIDHYTRENIENIQAVSSLVENQNSHRSRKRINSFLERIKESNDNFELIAFKQQNRDALFKACSPFLEIFQKENPYFSTLAFVLPQNINFLRVHNPKKFGDDITVIRPDIVDANLNFHLNSGYIVAGTGLIYSVVKPVKFKDEHLGVLQFGIKESQLTDELRKIFKIPVAVVMSNEKARFITRSKIPAFATSSFTVRSSEIGIFKHVDPHIDWDKIEWNSKKQQRVTIDDKTFLLVPILNLLSFNQSVQGHIIGLFDITPMVADLHSSIAIVCLVCLFVLLISFYILNKGYDSLSKQITQRNRQLALEKERLAVTLRSIGDGVITTDLEGSIVLVNKVAEKLTGWLQEQAVGKPLLDVFNIINEKTGETSKNPVEKVLATGLTVFLSKDTVLLSKDGTKYKIKDSVAPIYNIKESEIIGTVLVFRKITGVAAIKHKYRHLFNSLGDAIFVHDMNGRILDANDCACHRYGYCYKEFLKMKVSDIDVVEQVKYIDDRLAKLKENGHITFETEHRDCDDNIFPVEATAKLGEYEGRQIVLVISHEISERKRMEEELLKIEKLESVGILAGGIAHDFNNILAAILGNIEMAEMYTEETSEAYLLLDTAKKASIRAKDLTQQLLTFAKGSDPVKKTASVSQIITDAADFVLYGSVSRCNYDISEDLWDVEVDSGQISQVIQNIVINARDALVDGGVITITCENITHIGEQNVPLLSGNYVRITLKDGGPGIAEEDIDKVFDPYFSTKQMGSGLGLAICHSIILKHNGSISVESKVGEGTKFTIYLPASLEKATEAQAKALFVETENRATVMVVDDETMILNMIEKMLSMIGHKALLVNNGQEAVDTYREYLDNGLSIDLIIMDLTIPGGMGGKEAVKEILNVNSEAKVVVSSGYASDPVVAHCQKYGFKASLSKPFQLGELNEVINAVLEDK